MDDNGEWLKGQIDNRMKLLAEYGNTTITRQQAEEMEDEEWFAFTDEARLKWQQRHQNGIQFIADERKRQLDVHGFDSTSKTDAEFYKDGQLCDAAVHYIADGLTSCWPENWTTAPKFNGDRIRDLTKAGAMIAAEIDRLKSLEND